MLHREHAHGGHSHKDDDCPPKKLAGGKIPYQGIEMWDGNHTEAVRRFCAFFTSGTHVFLDKSGRLTAEWGAVNGD
jgi:hypothetical protein